MRKKMLILEELLSEHATKIDKKANNCKNSLDYHVDLYRLGNPIYSVMKYGDIVIDITRYE